MIFLFLATAPPQFAVLIGTRPQVAKLAPSTCLLEARDRRPRAIDRGQHRELLEAVLLELKIEPDHRWDVLWLGQPLGPLGEAGWVSL
ncbi:MAG: hypothetical protein RJP95_01295 [Pirellulales bacterium]